MKQSLFEQIKNSKKYKDLSDEIIRKEIKEYLRKNPDSKRYKNKKIVKDIKAELHKLTGRFQIKKRKKKQEYLNKKDYEGILSTNLSTKERLKDYDKLYSLIFSTTGRPKIILDIGCGINPCSYPIMKIKSKYLAYDINQGDIDFVNEFFKKFNIKGKAEILDLRDIDNVKKLPKADLCLMFKIIDPLEKGKGHKLSEKIIKNLKCKYIVASFATKTISRKPMKYPYRGWFERMLNRNKFKWEKINTNSEVYYIVKI